MIMRPTLAVLLATLSSPLVHANGDHTVGQSESVSEIYPWSEKIPADIRKQYIEPQQMLDEPSAKWRDEVAAVIHPLIKDCKSDKEAALLISKNIGKLTGVHYSTARTRACMNPLESLEQKKASCTGLSLLFAAALRSVDIPSRIVGVVSWNHVRGNHTWTEVWLDGKWHMLEMGESDFNTGWVMDAVGMLDSKNPYQRVLAITGKKREDASTAPHFYLPWDMSNKSVEAEDVSARYQQLARNWYEKNGLAADQQRLLIDILPRTNEEIIIKLVNAKGETLASGPAPKPEDDMREMLRLSLPLDKSQDCSLLFPDGSMMKIAPTDAPTQVIRLQKQKNES